MINNDLCMFYGSNLKNSDLEFLMVTTYTLNKSFIIM